MAARQTAAIVAGLAVIALSMPATVTMANTTRGTAENTAQTLSSSYGIEDLKDVKGVWEDFDTFTGTSADIHYLEDFDYRSSGPYYFPWGTNGNTHTGVYGIPGNWTQWKENPGNQSIVYAQSPDGRFTMHWIFIQEPAPSFDESVLDRIVVTVNDEPLDSWSKDVNEYNLTGDLWDEKATIRVSGVPKGLETVGHDTTSGSMTMASLRWNADLDGHSYVSDSYYFYNATVDLTGGLGDLAAVKAYATTDGKSSEITGFDYRTTGYRVDRNTQVSLTNVPSSWTMTSSTTPYRTVITLTAPNGYERSYTFETPITSRTGYLIDEDEETDPKHSWPFTETDDGEWRLRDAGEGDAIPATASETVKDSVTVSTVWTDTDGEQRTSEDTLTRLPDPVETVTGVADPLTGERVDSTTYRYAGAGIRCDIAYTRIVQEEARSVLIGNTDYALTKGDDGTWTADVTLPGKPSTDDLTVTMHGGDTDGDTYTLTGTDHGDSIVWTGTDTTVTVTWKPTELPASPIESLTASANGVPVSGFDPLKGGSWTVPHGVTAIDFDGLPEGWTLSGPTAGGDGSFSYTVENTEQGVSITYTFTPAETTYSVDDLKNVRLTVDGEDVPGFDYHGGDFEVEDADGTIRLIGLPDGWNVNPIGNGVSVSSPDGTVRVEYTLHEPKPAYSVDDLKDVTALADGTPVEGFDYRGGTFTVPAGTERVVLERIPDDWTDRPLEDGLGFTVSSPDGTVTVEYRFVPGTPDYSADMLDGVTAMADGKPVDGFDPVAGGDFDIPAGAGKVELGNVPEGWTTRRLTVEDGFGWAVSSPDGTVTVEYRFHPLPPEYSVDDLKNVTATADGNPVEGFDYRGGTFTVPKNADIRLSNIPSDWTVKHEEDTLTWNVVSPDGRVRASYVFEYENPAYSVDDLRNVRLTADGTPVKDFDYRGGEFTVPAGTNGTALTGVPDGWEAGQGADGLSWTVSSPDGTVRVTYRVSRLPRSTGELKNMDATVDGEPVDGFDPTRSGSWTVPAGTVQVDVSTPPAGWTLTRISGLEYRIRSDDGVVALDWLFVPAMPEYSVDDLKDVTATVDGNPVDGFDYHGGTFTVPENAKVRMSGFPSDWIVEHEDTMAWTVSSPDNTVVVSYSFNPKHVPSLDDLKDVTLGDHTPAGFDPVHGGSWTLPNGVRPSVENLPDGWSADVRADGHGWRIVVSCGSLRVTYLLANEYGPADLTGLRPIVDGIPLDGFDPANPGPYTVGMTARIEWVGLPDGWGMDDSTLTSPDGSWGISYRIERSWMTSDLRTVQVNTGDYVIKDFDPIRAEATWRIPHDATPMLSGVPEGVSVAWADVDNGVRAVLSADDGTVLAMWTFERMPVYSADDVRDVKVLVDGKPVLAESGVVTDVEENADIAFQGLPDGWTVNHKTRDDGVEEWTLTSPDGRITVSYLFHRIASNPVKEMVEGLLAETGARLPLIGVGLVLATGVILAGVLAWRRFGRSRRSAPDA